MLFVDSPSRAIRRPWLAAGVALGLAAIVVLWPKRTGPTPPPLLVGGPVKTAPAAALPQSDSTGHSRDSLAARRTLPQGRVSPPPAPPKPTPVVQSAPQQSAPPDRPAAPGRLFVNSVPWGQVYIDGKRLGNTPIVDYPVPAGVHRLRVERRGFRPFDQHIDVAPGRELRLTGIVLRERGS